MCYYLGMDTKSLETKKSDIEASFNTLKAEQKTHSDKVTEIETQLVQLQGEYRLVNELIESLNKKKDK